jgi:hypothetical protein
MNTATCASFGVDIVFNSFGQINTIAGSYGKSFFFFFGGTRV